ncbi:MAG: D-aminoacylase [Proteobacteria bacterium]|nr:D-aminoacylase [Pseudomonadota bacterium]
MHDLIIRGGTVIDGSGNQRVSADIAIDGDRITAVGRIDAAARRTIDAAGCLVTPGWVDVHTHYDGQATWDPILAPSSWHGVTTVVMGNCGVGFAPVRPGQEKFLIELMEGVEDIPGAALAEGIDWRWESFAQYLDALEEMPRTIDIATQVPHGAVRAYVMGERCNTADDLPTADEIAAMAAIVRDGIKAGALGFSSSRTLLHKDKHGIHVPGTFAGSDEMLALAEEARRQGIEVRPQMAGRPTGVLHGLQSNFHVFVRHPTFVSELAPLPLDAMVERMRDPAVKAKILAEHSTLSRTISSASLDELLWQIFPLGEKPNYEPDRADSVAGIAERNGRDAFDVMYDLLVDHGGKELFYQPLGGYRTYNFDFFRENMQHPNILFGLSDGGAHCGIIADAGMPTFILTHWARDRTKGEQLPLEYLVRKLSFDTASAYGMHDRGRLVAGQLADVNIIDFTRLALHRPEAVFDLPTGGKRLVQQVDGYRHIIKRGVPIFADGEHTGALPGKLVRG